jgi:hypothetical protein
MNHLLNLVDQRLNAANLLGISLLGGSIIVSAALSYIQGGKIRSVRGFWRHFLPPEAFYHPSGRADMLFYASRTLTNLVAVVPGAFLAVSVGQGVNGILQHVAPIAPGASPTLILILVL